MMYTSRLILLTFTFLMIAFNLLLAQDFFCRPWLKVDNRETFGESFSIKIENGDVFIRGTSSPITNAKLVYTHPLYDVFMSASGEIVTAGVTNGELKLNMFFPNEDIFYFITTSCRII